jgi:hypothetical protein
VGFGVDGREARAWGGPFCSGGNVHNEVFSHLLLQKREPHGVGIVRSHARVPPPSNTMLMDGLKKLVVLLVACALAWAPGGQVRVGENTRHAHATMHRTLSPNLGITSVMTHVIPNTLTHTHTLCRPPPALAWTSRLTASRTP